MAKIKQTKVNIGGEHRRKLEELSAIHSFNLSETLRVAVDKYYKEKKDEAQVILRLVEQYKES